MEIKELEKSEIAQVVELYGEGVPTAEGKEAVMSKFGEKIEEALEKDHMLIALENEKAVGFSWAQIREMKDGMKMDKVIMLLISLDRYGVGIGGQLMEKEREYAREKGAGVLDIEAR